MALAMTAKQYVWLQCALAELGINSSTVISCDNTGAIDLLHNPRIGDRSKHIDVQYYFTRELMENGTLTVLNITSYENLADICIKELPAKTFYHLLDQILDPALS